MLRYSVAFFVLFILFYKDFRCAAAFFYGESYQGHSSLPFCLSHLFCFSSVNDFNILTCLNRILYLYASINNQPFRRMKGLVRIVLFLLIVVLSSSLSSCSKKSSGFKYPAHRPSGATSYDPGATKHQPIRKKYVIHQRRGNILGHKKPF